MSALALATLGVVLGPHARAQGERMDGVHLHWVRAQGAESCVSGAALARQVEGLHGAGRSEGSGGEPVIEGLVERVDVDARPGWRARIRLVDAAGSTAGAREVESVGSDCAALTPAISLLLAWMVDSPPEPTPIPGANPAALAASPPSTQLVHAQEPGSPPARNPAAAWATELGAGLAGALGVRPEPTFGPRLELQLSSPWRLALGLGVSYWSADRVAREAKRARQRGDFSRAPGTARAVRPAATPRPLQSFGCWGGVVGGRFTRGSGLAEAYNPAQLYGGPTGALRVAYRLRARWAVNLECAGIAFTREDRFTYVAGDGASRVLFQPPRFGGWLARGILARL